MDGEGVGERTGAANRRKVVGRPEHPRSRLLLGSAPEDRRGGGRDRDGPESVRDWASDLPVGLTPGGHVEDDPESLPLLPEHVPDVGGAEEGRGSRTREWRTLPGLTLFPPLPSSLLLDLQVTPTVHPVSQYRSSPEVGWSTLWTSRFDFCASTPSPRLLQRPPLGVRPGR